MKEELQSKLVEILTSIQTATGKAADFAVEQLPDIAQSYVAYGRTVAALHVAAVLAGCVASALVFRWAWVKPWHSTYSWAAGKKVRADSNQVVLIFAGISTGAFALFLVPVITDGALVWLAPRVWLLKEIAQLVK